MNKYRLLTYNLLQYFCQCHPGGNERKNWSVSLLVGQDFLALPSLNVVALCVPVLHYSLASRPLSYKTKIRKPNTVIRHQGYC